MLLVLHVAVLEEDLGVELWCMVLPVLSGGWTVWLRRDTRRPLQHPQTSVEDHGGPERRGEAACLEGVSGEICKEGLWHFGQCCIVRGEPLALQAQGLQWHHVPALRRQVPFALRSDARRVVRSVGKLVLRDVDDLQVSAGELVHAELEQSPPFPGGHALQVRPCPSCPAESLQPVLRDDLLVCKQPCGRGTSAEVSTACTTGAVRRASQGLTPLLSFRVVVRVLHVLRVSGLLLCTTTSTASLDDLQLSTELGVKVLEAAGPAKGTLEVLLVRWDPTLAGYLLHLCCTCLLQEVVHERNKGKPNCVYDNRTNASALMGKVTDN